MTETKKYTSQNRLAWDEIAEVREKKMETAEFFAEGGCTLSNVFSLLVWSNFRKSVALKTKLAEVSKTVAFGISKFAP